jgi:hypothetical protein
MFSEFSKFSSSQKILEGAVMKQQKWIVPVLSLAMVAGTAVFAQTADQTTTTTQTAGSSQPMTKKEMKAQRKQQKAQEKSAKENAKAASEQAKAKEHTDKATNAAEKSQQDGAGQPITRQTTTTQTTAPPSAP